MSFEQVTVGSPALSVGQVLSAGAQVPKDVHFSPVAQPCPETASQATQRVLGTSHLVRPKEQPSHWASEVQLFNKHTPVGLPPPVPVSGPASPLLPELPPLPPPGPGGPLPPPPPPQPENMNATAQISVAADAEVRKKRKVFKVGLPSERATE